MMIFIGTAMSAGLQVKLCRLWTATERSNLLNVEGPRISDFGNFGTLLKNMESPSFIPLNIHRSIPAAGDHLQ